MLHDIVVEFVCQALLRFVCSCVVSCGEKVVLVWSSSTLIYPQEAAPIIRNFNHIARSLVEFETLWHMAWMRTIDVSKKGLNATLLRRDPRDGEYR